MTPVSDLVFDTLHSTATEIFTGALAACNIESAFDRRIRFEGNLLRRLMPDGSGPETIDLSSLQANLCHRHRQSRRAHARRAAAEDESPQGTCAASVAPPSCPKSATGDPLLRGRPSAAQRGLVCSREGRACASEKSQKGHPDLLPHLRGRFGYVRSSSRSDSHAGRHHGLSPGTAGVGRPHRRDQHPAQALFRGERRPAGDGGAGLAEGFAAAPGCAAAFARCALIGSHIARSLHRGRCARHYREI